jgi:prolyl-tRNA editing enzyme YbaK/EbsC (Cys-tRNA(Pro) deacylase)
MSQKQVPPPTSEAFEPPALSGAEGQSKSQLPLPEALNDEPRGRKWLRELGYRFRDHVFEYVEKGGTSYSSVAIGASEHAVIKTLIFQATPMAGASLPTDLAPTDGHLVVLMHGDWNVDTKALLVQLVDLKESHELHEPVATSNQVLRKVAAADPQRAEHWTGYRVGGTAPFALATPLSIYIESSILDLPRIWINAGARGHLLEMETSTLTKTLQLKPIRAGKPRAPRV